MSATDHKHSNVDQSEIDKFSALAHQWWDPEGHSRPLHEINPLRLQFIDMHCGGLAGKRAADIGCGGGLLSEAMTKSGATVSAIDMSAEALTVARLHALENELEIDYQQSTAEQFAENHAEQFDVITCLEMLEHVPDPAAVVKACADMVKPGGMVFFSTLNRTLKAKVLGVWLAEYVLKWLPAGTHDADKFIRPSELLAESEKHGLEEIAMTGIHYNPLSGRFFTSNRNVDVNYIVACRKPA